MRLNRNLISAIILSTAVYGCDDSKDEPIINNLSVTSIDSGPVSELQAYDELHVFYELKVEGFNGIDLDIYFYALNINEMDNSIYNDDDNVEMEYYYNLGNMIVEDISEGNVSLTATLTLPPEMNGGDYKVIAMVDPHDRHEETIESDNQPSDVHTEYAYTTIHVAELSQHDFIIDSVELGSNAIVLDIPENETRTTSNHSEIIGYINAIYEGKADTEGLLHASVYINGIWKPVTFWDHENNVYSESDSIVFRHTDYAHHFGFDLNFPHEILELLHLQYSSEIVNSLQIKFEIENIHTKQESTTVNNFKIVNIPYYFFDNSANLNSKSIKLQSKIKIKDENEVSTGLLADFGHTFGDKNKAAARLVLGAGVALNPINKSISLKGEAGVYSYIFNAESELLKAEIEKRYVLGQSKAYTNYYYYSFGNKVFQITNYDDASIFKHDWSVKEELASQRFFVGPVPLRVAAGVEGRIGYDIGLGFGYSEIIDMNYSVSLIGKLIDDLNLNLFVNGQIDLAATRAGVEAELNLIKESFIIEMTAGVDSENTAWSELELGYGMSIKNEIDVISGKFGLVSEVYVPKFCKKWGVALPCGFKWKKYHLWLYQTDSVYKKEWTLYEDAGYKNL